MAARPLLPFAAASPAWAVILVSLGTAPTTALADHVVADGVTYTSARVDGLQGGRLSIRTSDGTEVLISLSSLSVLQVDSVSGFTDFNEAEQLQSEGNVPAAIPRYERALRMSKRFWPDLIAARLVSCCDRAGPVDRATMYFIRTVRGEDGGVAAAAEVFPDSTPKAPTTEVMRAVQELGEALRGEGNAERLFLLRLRRQRLLSATGDRRAAESADKLAQEPIPSTAATPRVYRPYLAVLEEALGREVAPAYLASLDRVIGDGPVEVLPAALLLRGRSLLRVAKTREEVIRAAWPLMRVAIHFSNDPRAAEALCDAASALHRLGREEKAAALLAEAVAHPQASPEVRARAEGALAEWRRADAQESPHP